MKDLEPLARQLGVSVEHLWGVLLRQAPISGSLDLLLYAITAIVVYGTYKLWLWTIKNVNDENLDESNYLIPSFLSVLVFATVVFSLCSLPNTLAAFFNPEYWALQEIMSSVRRN